MQSTKERRRKYAAMESKGFTPEEVVHLMDIDELEMNARKGGILAKVELKRRNALAGLKTTLDDRDLDIGC